jgi:1-acyl-sn-glycerol-3-phosphate acyltransferase
MQKYIISYFWIMLRALIGVLLIPYWIWLIVVFLAFLITSTVISLLLLLMLGKKAHNPTMAVYKFWSTFFFVAAGIRIRVKNRERLYNHLPCIVVCNHGSNLDMFLGAYAMPTSIKPLAKMQLKKMPLLGFLFTTVCVMVDRSSKESRERSSRAMLETLQEGKSIFIFPEGTRNKGTKPVNVFYDGAFRFGIESGFPIVAMCTIGARSVTPSNGYSVRPGKIDIHFLGPYHTKDLTKEDLPELKTRIFNDMFAEIKTQDPMFQSAE